MPMLRARWCMAMAIVLIVAGCTASQQYWRASRNFERGGKCWAPIELQRLHGPAGCMPLSDTAADEAQCKATLSAGGGHPSLEVATASLEMCMRTRGWKAMPVVFFQTVPLPKCVDYPPGRCPV